MCHEVDLFTIIVELRHTYAHLYLFRDTQQCGSEEQKSDILYMWHAWGQCTMELQHVQDMVCSLELEKDRTSTFHKVLCAQLESCLCTLVCTNTCYHTAEHTTDDSCMHTQTHTLTCTLLYSLPLTCLPSYIYTCIEGGIPHETIVPPSPYPPSTPNPY